MKAFRYQAIELNGAPVKGEIEAADRKAALQLLGARGLFPSVLEYCTPTGVAAARPVLTAAPWPPSSFNGSSQAGFAASKPALKSVTALLRLPFFQRQTDSLAPEICHGS